MLMVYKLAHHRIIKLSDYRIIALTSPRKNKFLIMISRRNIRVKVMQTMYTLETGGQLTPEESVKILQKHFSQTRLLFAYLIYFITELARYAETHSRNRLGKHLPTQEDRN